MTGPVGRAPRAYPRALRAFAFRDFRLLWGAAVVSSSGSQMQLAAMGWVVALLTHSATKVGFIAFAGVVPLVVLSPVGGSLADHFSRRRVLIITQAVQMGQAVALWATWQAGLRSFELLAVLAALGGVTAALNAPVWQAYIPSLVPRRDLPNAVMLNSAQFNISKALGPVAAGLLLVNTAGASWCFLLNAVSFACVLVALLAMRTPDPADARSARPGFWQDFLEGVSYVRRNPGLRAAFIVTAFTALVAQPVVPLIPVVALDMFDTSAVGFGVLAGAYGIGAIIGAVLTGHLDGRRLASRIMTLGFVVVSLFLVGLGIAPTLVVGLLALIGAGAGLLVVIATNNSCIQHLSSDSMRGRVMGIWLVVYGLSNPSGVLAQGAIADAVGVRWVLVADGLLVGIFVCWLVSSGRIRTQDAMTDAPETELSGAGILLGPVDPEENS
jgi:MFS family permease